MSENRQGWSWFTKQKRSSGGDEESTESYPPLVTGTNDRMIKLEYAKALRSGLNCDEVRASFNNENEQKTDSTELGLHDQEAEESTSSSENEENPGSLEQDDGGDAYAKLRKDAIRVSRSISKHARAAAAAFQRGDHHRAKQLSQQIEQNKSLLRKLNAQAAESIVNLRNGSNDLWTVDLHGLHSAEAVAVLRKRLSDLEANSSSSSSSSSRHCFEESNKSFLGHSASDLLLQGEVHQQSSSTRSLLLQHELLVITGTGVHSRNGPSLPNAIKTFLYTNSYRFSEPRPGSISVKLKLRRPSNPNR